MAAILDSKLPGCHLPDAVNVCVEEQVVEGWLQSAEVERIPSITTLPTAPWSDIQQLQRADPCLKRVQTLWETGQPLSNSQIRKEAKDVRKLLKSWDRL